MCKQYEGKPILGAFYRRSLNQKNVNVPTINNFLFDKLGQVSFTKYMHLKVMNYIFFFID